MELKSSVENLGYQDQRSTELQTSFRYAFFDYAFRVGGASLCFHQDHWVDYFARNPAIQAAVEEFDKVTSRIERSLNFGSSGRSARRS